MQVRVGVVLFSGAVTVPQFNTALTSAFPMKSEARVQALLNAALEELELPQDGSAMLEHNASTTASVISCR